MADTITYENLQKDSDFLGDAYWFLQDTGQQVSKDPKDILDTFIEKRRAFDVNVGATYGQGSTIAESSGETQLFYKRALDKLDKMPDFYSSGGAPTGPALLDYLYYGVTDPTNLISILAGAATLPAGGTGAVGVFAAKQGITAAVRASMKAKLKASISKPVLKALALEGTIAGTGGAVQAKLSQDTDMDIGRRKEGDYDYSTIVLQGILEGTLSPVLGSAINIGGTGLSELARKGVPKLTSKVPGGKKVNEAAHWGGEWLKRNFMPPASQDAHFQRLNELTSERYKKQLDNTEKNSKLIFGAEQNFAGETDEVLARSVLNDILEEKDINTVSKIKTLEDEVADLNYQKSMDVDADVDYELALATEKLNSLTEVQNKTKAGLYDKFRKINPDIDEHLNNFRDDIKYLQDEAGEIPYITNQFEDTYKKTDSYVRDIYEKFTTKREDFDKWLAKPENKNVMEDYKQLVLGDERKLIELKVTKRPVASETPPMTRQYNEEFKNIDGSLNEEVFDAVLKADLKNKYEPVLNKKSKYGILKERTYLSPVEQQVYGKNFSPAVRMMETTSDLIDSITDMRMTGNVIDSLTARSTVENPLIVKANTAEGASAKAGGGDWVPLYTRPNLKEGAEPVFNNEGVRTDFFNYDLKDPDAVFVLRGDFVSEEIGGNTQLAVRSDFVPQQRALELGLDDGSYGYHADSLDPIQSFGVIDPPEPRAQIRYVYEKDIDGKIKKDATGKEIIRTDNEGNPVKFFMDPVTNKYLPKDINTYQHYIPKEFAKRYKEMLSNEDVVEASFGTPKTTPHKFAANVIKWVAEAQGYLKKGKTVYNPIAIVRNIIGAGGYMINSGNYSGFLHLAKLYSSGTKAQKKELMEKAQRLGLKGSQIELNQILNRIGKQNVGVKGTTAELGRRILTGQVLGLLEGTKFDKGLIKLYGATDDIGKLGTWMSEQMTQTRIWNKTSEADKTIIRNNFIDSQIARNTLTPSELKAAKEVIDNVEVFKTSPKSTAALEKFDKALTDEIAAQKALDLVPIYSRIPKIIEKLRGVPVVGNFAAFPAENLRNKYKLFQIAGDEIKRGFETGNMEMVRAGSRRVLAQTAYASAPALIAYTYNQLEGTSEAADAIREGVQEFQKDHPLAVRKGKDGKYYYTDLAYSNTDAAVLDIITPFLASGARGEDPLQVLDEIFPRAVMSYLSSFVEPSIITEVFSDMVSYYKSDTDEQRANILGRMGKNMAPGVIKSIAEVSADLGAFSHSTITAELEAAFNPLFNEDRKRFDDSADLSSFLARHSFNTKGFGDRDEVRDFILGPALASFGIVSGEKEWNPRKTFAYISRSLQRNVLTDVAETKRDMIAKMSDPTLPYDTADMLKEYNELFAEQFVAQQGIAKLIGAYSNVLSTTELNSIIRDKKIRGSLSQAQIGNIHSGKFFPEELSKNFIADVRKGYSKAIQRGKVPQESFAEIISAIRQIHHMWKFRDLNIEDPKE